ncbi:helicase associated domain-containing protein [Arthrobacter sp. HLT1-21]
MAHPAGIKAEGDPDEDWGPCISVAEWKLMYLRGLSIEQIAHHCRVPEKRVQRVIRSFERRQPELAGTRLIVLNRPTPPTDAELSRKPPRPSWEDRLKESKEFRRRQRRMPRVLAKDLVEQELAVWVAGQRKQLRRGTLDPSRQTLLTAALGDWAGTPRPAAQSDLWEQRLNDVLAWTTKNGRPPRRTKGGGRPENILATWLVTQRGLHRRNTLDPARRARLDERLPGWAETRPSSSRAIL